jgi:WD domain, G-beta repeat
VDTVVLAALFAGSIVALGVVMVVRGPGVFGVGLLAVEVCAALVYAAAAFFGVLAGVLAAVAGIAGLVGLAAAGNARGRRLAHAIRPADAAAAAATLTGHGGAVNALGFDPDAPLLATASADKTVIVWDLTDRRRPTRAARLDGGRRPVRAVTFSPAGRLLATGDAGNTVTFWDLAVPSSSARTGGCWPRPAAAR